MLRSFIGVMLLCAVTIYISAGCRSSFHAVSIAAVSYGLPVLLWFIMPIGFIFSLVRVLIYASTFYQCMCSSIYDVGRIWHILAAVAIVISIICVIAACWQHNADKRTKHNDYQKMLYSPYRHRPALRHNRE